MQDIYNKLQSHLHSALPFAIYRKPGAAMVKGIFQKDNTIYDTNNFTGQGFVFAPFTGSGTVFLPFNKSEIISAQFLKTDNKTEGIREWPVNGKDKKVFEDLVSNAVTAIHNNEFKKVVLSRKEVIQGKVNIVTIYNELLQLYPTALVYCFYHEVSGLWMGATPEQLVKAENNIIYTVALAGTQIYKNDNEVTWQYKEEQEQQIVTDYITRSLEHYTYNKSVSEPYTHRAGNIVHIKTDIKAELLAGYTVKHIIDVLHPTPAVCGMPKQQAKNFILANESYNREYYSGYLGEINCNTTKNGNKITDLFVNLRCMKIEGDNAHLYIGCGITGDSDPEKEFIETVNKSRTLKNALQ